MNNSTVTFVVLAAAVVVFVWDYSAGRRRSCSCRSRSELTRARCSRPGVSAKTVLMCVVVAAAASFLTPVATPANLMVMSPAGYRFGDYWKLGLPLIALFGVVAVLLVRAFWHF